MWWYSIKFSALSWIPYNSLKNRNESNRRNFSTRNRIRERNDSQPNSINQIPRENTISIVHENRQRNELERIDNQIIGQNEIDSNNNNNESEGNSYLIIFVKLKLRIFQN